MKSAQGQTAGFQTDLDKPCGFIHRLLAIWYQICTDWLGIPCYATGHNHLRREDVVSRCFLPSFSTKDAETTKSKCILVLSFSFLPSFLLHKGLTNHEVNVYIGAFLPSRSFLLHKGRRNHEINVYIGTFLLFPSFLLHKGLTNHEINVYIGAFFLPSAQRTPKARNWLMRNLTHNNPSVRFTHRQWLSSRGQQLRQ